MSDYRIKNRTVNSDDPALPELLAAIYENKERRRCLCREPSAEMYVAQVYNRFLIKRMPDTGSQHDSSCDSDEAPTELSGLGDVLDPHRTRL